MSNNDKIYASDLNCVSCGKQAVAFWPCIDPDIVSKPYCRKCLDEIQHELLMRMIDEGK